MNTTLPNQIKVAVTNTLKTIRKEMPRRYKGTYTNQEYVEGYNDAVSDIRLVLRQLKNK